MRKLTKTMLVLSVMVSIAMVSCKDKDGQETETLETEAVDNTEVADEPFMDTVVTDDDTIVKTGGGDNDNPVGEQVP